MSELVVKDNALMNASYNLNLVEQRLILLAIIEASIVTGKQEQCGTGQRGWHDLIEVSG